MFLQHVRYAYFINMGSYAVISTSVPTSLRRRFAKYTCKFESTKLKMIGILKQFWNGEREHATNLPSQYFVPLFLVVP